MHILSNKKNKTFLVSKAILLFLIIINFTYFYLNLKSNINSSSYAFNELFINYQAGLIRRGLLGEIFWILNKFFLIKPITFFCYLFLILHITQIFLFFKIYQKYLESYFIYVLIFFSPALILFHIYDPNLYFIKDIFIKITILLHAYLLLTIFNQKKDFEKYILLLKFVIIPFLILVILIHEYQVIFLSVHYLFSLSIIKNKKNIIQITKIYSVLLIPIIFVLVFIGDQIQFDNLNQILSKFNVEVHSQLAGGFYKAIGGFYKWHFFHFSYRDFLNLFFSIILSLLVFYFIFQYLIEKKILKFHSHYQKKYFIYFAPSILIFILATDHGRNISLISFHLIAFYSILSFNLNKFQFFKDKINKIFLLKTFSILFLFFYIFMWKLDQMAGFGLRGIPNDIFQSSLFAEISKFIKFLYTFIDLNILELPKINL